MSDMGAEARGIDPPGVEARGIEAPDADAAEQHQDVVAETPEDVAIALVKSPPLEANEADAAEQGQELDPGDDEYR